MGWKFETAGPTGECKAFGVNIFKYPGGTARRPPLSPTPATAWRRCSMFMRWRSAASSVVLPAASFQTVCLESICRRSKRFGAPLLAFPV